MNAEIRFLETMSQHVNEGESGNVALPLIEVDDLTKTYRCGLVKALDGIKLSVNQGEIFGLIGTNGAGKTTLMGCLLGLLKPDSGSICIDGQSPLSLDVLQITGYMPERPDFEHWMTARQFLTYHHMLSGGDKESREHDIDSVLCRVELQKSAWERRLSTYSRGMLQRLNIAQLLIGSPRVLLLDEPTLGLDPSGVAVLRKILMECQSEGITAIVNSHQLDEVERVCDRVAFIKQGRIESIESLRKKRDTVHAMLVCWTAGYKLSGQEAYAIGQKAGVILSDCGKGWARFAISDQAARPHLIRHLVEAGVPITQAVCEHEKLESLFERLAEAG